MLDCYLRRVILTFAAVAAGLTIGLALPARHTRFARPRVYKWGLLVAGVAGQVIAARLDGGGAASLSLLSLVLLAWFATTNLHLTGMGVLAIGVCTNILPILLNEGMPVRAQRSWTPVSSNPDSRTTSNSAADATSKNPTTCWSCSPTSSRYPPRSRSSPSVISSSSWRPST